LLARSWGNCKTNASLALAVREAVKQHSSAEGPPLSPYRAFVVQFRTETDVEQGHYAGRVEQVVSGQATHFASLEELLAFMARVLATVGSPACRRPGRGG